VKRPVGNLFTPLSLRQIYEILAQQLGLKNSSSEFDDNQTNSLVAGSRYVSWAETGSCWENLLVTISGKLEQPHIKYTPKATSNLAL
jgi:hypothetical protein